MRSIGRGIILLLLIVAALVFTVTVKDIEKQAVAQKSVKEEELTEEQTKQKVIKVQVVAIQPPPPQPDFKPPIASPMPNPDSSDASDCGGGKCDPAIVGSYDISITEYLAFMRNHGAQVGIYDRAKEKFVGAINRNRRLTSNISLSGVSSRARRITQDYPDSINILDQVRERYGPGRYEILLLLPVNLADRLQQNIFRTIREWRLDPSEVLTVHVSYQGNSKSVRVVVERLETTDGSTSIQGSSFSL